MARLLLIRHGPSAYVPTTTALRRHEVEAWRVAYDAAGILPDAVPPRALLESVAGARVYLASDMRRASESAARLARGRSVITTSLLREAPLAVPSWPTRLPFRAWGALIYLAWKVAVPLGTPLSREELERVVHAAAYLRDTVPVGQTGVAVTHGVFRALLAAELKRTGWRETARTGGYGHWSAWAYERVA